MGKWVLTPVSNVCGCGGVVTPHHKTILLNSDTIYLEIVSDSTDLPDGSVVKNPQAMQETRVCFCLGSSPGGGNGDPLQCSC